LWAAVLLTELSHSAAMNLSSAMEDGMCSDGAAPHARSRATTLGPLAAERLPVLMQAVGFAVWQVQELENTAAHYVVVRLRAARGMGKEQGEAASREVEGLTFGRLLGELTRAGVVTPALGSRLEALVNERNWLVHRARRETRGVLSSEKQFGRVLQRIRSIADQALVLLRELAPIVEDYVVSTGVDRSFIDRESERLARSWGFVE